MLPGVEIVFSREKNGVEIGLGLWHLQESFVFKPFDAGKIAQRREAEDLQELFRRHIGKRRAWLRRAQGAIDQAMAPDRCDSKLK